MSRHGGARRQFKGRKGKTSLCGFGVGGVGFSLEACILLRGYDGSDVFLH